MKGDEGCSKVDEGSQEGTVWPGPPGVDPSRESDVAVPLDVHVLPNAAAGIGAQAFVAPIRRGGRLTMMTCRAGLDGRPAPGSDEARYAVRYNYCE